MSSTIVIRWDLGDEGLSRSNWAAFTAANGLGRRGGANRWYAGSGADLIEADYIARHEVSFRVSGGGYEQVTWMALTLWADFGGTLSASQELSALILRRHSRKPLKPRKPERTLGELARETYRALLITDAAIKLNGAPRSVSQPELPARDRSALRAVAFKLILAELLENAYTAAPGDLEALSRQQVPGQEN